MHIFSIDPPLGAIKDMSPEVEAKLNLAAPILFNLYSTTWPYEVFPDAKQFLAKLVSKRQEGSLKVGIISNYDKRIVNMVEALELASYFDFITYSEETKCSKPQKGIFEDAVRKSGLQNLTMTEILHIGDDLKKDYVGAKDMGWNAYLIARQEKVRKELLSTPNSKNSSIQIHENDICDSFRDVEIKLMNSD